MTQITKAHGKVTVTVVDGVVTPTFVATDGIIGQVMDGATGLLSTQTANVGNGAVFERLFSGLLGNGLAHYAHTGKVGVAVTEKLQFSFGA